MVLRLMQTLFVDNELPKSGKVLLNGLNAMKEDQEKAKAEQEETERKNLKSHQTLHRNVYCLM